MNEDDFQMILGGLERRLQATLSSGTPVLPSRERLQQIGLVTYLASTYDLDWLVKQSERIFRRSLETMRDVELSFVINDLKMAEDCLMRGLPLEEVFIDPLAEPAPPR